MVMTTSIELLKKAGPIKETLEEMKTEKTLKMLKMLHTLQAQAKQAQKLQKMDKRGKFFGVLDADGDDSVTYREFERYC